jgi:hypothetical protein
MLSRLQRERSVQGGAYFAFFFGAGLAAAFFGVLQQAMIVSFGGQFNTLAPRNSR